MHSIEDVPQFQDAVRDALLVPALGPKSKAHFLIREIRLLSGAVAHPSGFEPEASAFGGQRSIQLSYGCLAGRS